MNALNIIHYMHDKYAYEKLEMALHDRDVKRLFATGIAGLSVVADSLSAIKYAKVHPIYDETSGLITDFETVGEFPCYGNDDDRVDDIAVDVLRKFMSYIRKNPTYRESHPTMSVLTITSNVVYGKNTGNTPDGRRYGEPFAPGANPMHGRDKSGALKSLMSVAKLPYEDAEDGISNTFTIIPKALGHSISAEGSIVHLVDDVQVNNLVSLLDGYFTSGGYHLNVNVFNRETLKAAYDNPELYPNLTIRVSGYAVNFSNLTNEQKLEVMKRTFHEGLHSCKQQVTHTNRNIWCHGPGLRYVLFLQGCPLRCKFCHNRDTWGTEDNKLMTVEEILNDYNKYRAFYKKGGLTVSGGEATLQIGFLTALFKEAKNRNIHTCLDTSAGTFSEARLPEFEELLKYTDLVLLDIKHIDDERH